MSRAIRFTKAERDAVAEAAGMVFGARGGPSQRALVSLLTKMDAALAPAPVTAADFVAVRAAAFARLAEETLGDRVFLPPNPTSSWWGRLQATLTSQGIDAEGARVALEHVATWARQTQDVMSLAQRASRYLHDARKSGKEPHDGEADIAGRPPEFR